MVFCPSPLKSNHILVIRHLKNSFDVIFRVYRLFRRYAVFTNTLICNMKFLHFIKNLELNDEIMQRSYIIYTSEIRINHAVLKAKENGGILIKYFKY